LLDQVTLSLQGDDSSGGTPAQQTIVSVGASRKLKVATAPGQSREKRNNTDQSFAKPGKKPDGCQFTVPD
jgi:hypothetical protein